MDIVKRMIMMVKSSPLLLVWYNTPSIQFSLEFPDEIKFINAMEYLNYDNIPVAVAGLGTTSATSY